MAGDISLGDEICIDAKEEKIGTGIGVPLPRLDDALSNAIESVKRGEKRSIILWGDRFSGKTLAISRYASINGNLPLEHIQMSKDPFNEADAQRYMNQLREGVVLEGSYHQVCYLLGGGSLANKSDKTARWLERLECGIRKKLGINNNARPPIPDDFEEVWASFTKDDVKVLFNHYAEKIEREHPGIPKYVMKELERNRDSFVLMASLGDPWEENDAHRGRLIPSLLEMNMLEHAGKDENDLDKFLMVQKKNELLVSSFFGFTALDASIQGVNILGLVKETAGVLANMAPLLPLAGIAILGTSSLLGFVKAGKDNGFAKYVSVHASWIKLPIQKRRILCERIDERNELPPGSSYAFLEEWLSEKKTNRSDNADAFTSKFNDVFTKDFIIKVQSTIDENQDVKKELIKISDRIEELEASIKEIKEDIHAIKKDISIYVEKLGILQQKILSQDTLIAELKSLVGPINDEHKNGLGVFEKCYYLGNDFFSQARYAEAIEEYDKAIRLNPNEPEIHYLKAIALDELEKYAEAIEEYDKAIRLNPKGAKYLTNKGISLANLSRYAEAINAFEKAIRLNPKDVYLHYAKAFVLDELQMHAEAIKEYDKAIRLNPDYPEVHYDKANTLAILSRYTEAIKEYNKAIQLNPSEAAFHNNKGIALASLARCENSWARYDEAIEEYDNAIRLNPNDPNFYFNKGNALNNLLKEAAAVEEYDKAIQLNPNEADFHYNKGVALDDLSRYAESVEEYDKAIQLNPNEANYHYKKGVALDDLSRYAESVEEYNNAIRLNPNVADYHYERARALVALANGKVSLAMYVEAVEEYDKAIQLNPNVADYHFFKGLALANLLNKHAEAIKEYDKAIQLNPNRTEFDFEKYNALMSLGMYTEAIIICDKALRLRPDDSFMRMKREIAERKLSKK